jgi:hypothetical protein
MYTHTVCYHLCKCVTTPLPPEGDADDGQRCWLVKAVRDPDRLGCAVQGCEQTYKKASVNVLLCCKAC